MARITGWRTVVEAQLPRFQILTKDERSFSMEVLDRNTHTAYMVQAAGKAEYQTMLTMSVIRSHLQLRFNYPCNCYEVYTTIHGTGIFRWYKISVATRDWYVRTFHDIHWGMNVQLDTTSGGFKLSP